MHGDECTRIFNTNGIPDNSPAEQNRTGNETRLTESRENFMSEPDKEDINEIFYVQFLYLKKKVKRAGDHRNL